MQDAPPRRTTKDTQILFSENIHANKPGHFPNHKIKFANPDGPYPAVPPVVAPIFAPIVAPIVAPVVVPVEASIHRASTGMPTGVTTMDIATPSFVSPRHKKIPNYRTRIDPCP
jgi:hypothetical protein